MGTKSEKKKINGLMGVSSGAPEFIKNLFDQIHHNNLSKGSKKIIKDTLAQKYKEFEIIGNSEADRFMRQNLHLFHSNITFDEKYQDCVLEINNNMKRVKMSNSLTEIRNSSNKKNDNKKRKSNAL